MPQELTFSFKDLYPEIAGEETGEKAIPDEAKQEVLSENADVAKEASKNAKPRFVFIALGLIIAFIVFFGSGDK